MNKLQWNLKRNSYIFVQEYAFENIVCEMAAILSRPECVKCHQPNEPEWQYSYNSNFKKTSFDTDIPYMSKTAKCALHSNVPRLLR